MRETRFAPLFLLLGAASCGQPNAEARVRTISQSPAPAIPADSPGPPVTSVGTLSGEWRVAGIDGRPLDGSYGLALRGDLDKLWWEPRCAGMARGYRIEGHSISFGSLEPPRPPGSPTPPVCAIGLPPRLGEVFRTLDAATTVARTPQNGIHIAGGGHSVTLFSQ